MCFVFSPKNKFFFCKTWEETIRGLRRCSRRDCKFVPLKRDRNGAQNIGANFQRRVEDKASIRSMSEADVAFYRATLCNAVNERTTALVSEGANSPLDRLQTNAHDHHIFHITYGCHRRIT